MTDPRTAFKTVFDTNLNASALTAHDGSTRLKYKVEWALAWDNIADLMTKQKHDLIITVKLVSVEAIGPASNSRGYEWLVEVTAWAIDKTANGDFTVSGAETMVKAADELLRVIRENVAGSEKEIDRGYAEEHKIGSAYLYSLPIRFKYRTFVAGTSSVSHTEMVLKHTWQMRIGKDANNYVTLERGIEDFEQWLDPHVTPQFAGTTITASASNKGYKNWRWRLTLLGDFYTGFYATDVQTAGGNQYAIVPNSDNNEIGYLVLSGTVIYGDSAQTQKTRTISITNGIVDTVRASLGNVFVYEGRAEYISYSDS